MNKFQANYLRMLEDAAQGKFTHIISEALDRLSRDQEDLAALHKHLNFHGVKLLTLVEGEINELHVGLKGTMNALYLKDLAQKTKRGLEGRVRDGFSAGGKSYGYDVIKEFDASGNATTGLLKINPLEAKIIERIFIDFAEGKSPRQIAKELNAEGIKGPKEKPWVDTAIRGHGKKGTGILNNERYTGKTVWNRLRYLKNPKTGKRISRVNPPSEWVIHENPDLRIITDNLWKSVKARQKIIADTATVRCDDNRLTGSRRLLYLLSGVLVCGECGGGYTIIGKDRYGCANRKNRGVCSNSATIKRQDIEKRVLAGLKDKLLEPHNLTVFLQEYLKEAKKVEESLAQDRVIAEKELVKVDKKLKAILSAIEQGIITESTKTRLQELEQERLKLEQQLAPAPLAIPKPDAGMIDLYRSKVDELADALNEPDVKTPAINALKPLINKVVLKPTNLKKHIRAELYGDIAGLVALENAKGQNFSGPLSQLSVVAGAGFGLNLKPIVLKVSLKR